MADAREHDLPQFLMELRYFLNYRLQELEDGLGQVLTSEELALLVAATRRAQAVTKVAPASATKVCPTTPATEQQASYEDEQLLSDEELRMLLFLHLRDDALEAEAAQSQAAELAEKAKLAEMATMEERDRLENARCAAQAEARSREHTSFPDVEVQGRASKKPKLELKEAVEASRRLQMNDGVVEGANSHASTDRPANEPALAHLSARLASTSPRRTWTELLSSDRSVKPLRPECWDMSYADARRLNSAAQGSAQALRGKGVPVELCEPPPAEAVATAMPKGTSSHLLDLTWHRIPPQMWPLGSHPQGQEPLAKGFGKNAQHEIELANIIRESDLCGLTDADRRLVCMLNPPPLRDRRAEELLHLVGHNRYVECQFNTLGYGRWDGYTGIFRCIVVCPRCGAKACNRRMWWLLDTHWTHYCDQCKRAKRR